MAQQDEKFVSRWSRLKRESQEAEKKPPAKEEPRPALPPLEKVTPESDFAPFMHPKVEDALRRVALKKLFSDPHFNVPDPFEAYSGDWTGGEPITEELLAQLNQARTLIFDEDDKEKKAQEERNLAQAPANDTTKDDETGRHDS